jgi:NAD(P)-dependent dehydrogenase (short-subunit alcohol dehydrogenase family)
MKRFEGKNVVITGGASGIGLATARRLASEGARVCIIGRTPANVQAVIESLEGEGHVGMPGNLMAAEDADRCFATAAAQMGRLHCAILCAGGHSVAPVTVVREKHFREMFDANVVTTVNAIRPFLKNVEPGGGSIVIVGSAAALRANPGVIAYSTAKGALIPFCKTLAMELAPRRIRVNIVLPGVVTTEMTERFFLKLSDIQRTAIAAAHPLGVGAPDDVAAVNAFLASDEARWITGAEMVVDGGLTLK